MCFTRNMEVHSFAQKMDHFHLNSFHKKCPKEIKSDKMKVHLREFQITFFSLEKIEWKVVCVCVRMIAFVDVEESFSEKKKIL